MLMDCRNSRIATISVGVQALHCLQRLTSCAILLLSLRLFRQIIDEAFHVFNDTGCFTVANGTLFGWLRDAPDALSQSSHLLLQYATRTQDTAQSQCERARGVHALALCPKLLILEAERFAR